MMGGMPRHCSVDGDLETLLFDILYLTCMGTTAWFYARTQEKAHLCNGRNDVFLSWQNSVIM